MAGLQKSTPVPINIMVHEQSRVLELVYAAGQTYRISFELLRVESPSAEVKGHGPSQEKLQVGKQEVLLKSLEPVGNYAVKPTFSDGHDTGIYSWDYLHELAVNQDRLWQNYLDKMQAAGASRMPAPPKSPNAPFEKWEIQPQVINIVRTKKT
jgi:DUF971 family protein